MLRLLFLFLLLSNLLACATTRMEPASSRRVVHAVIPPWHLRDVATTGTLVLEDAVAVAIEEDPELGQRFDRYEALFGRRPWPRPVEPEDSETDGVGVARRENQVNLSQTVPWFGKRGLRVALLNLEALEAFEEYRHKALELRQAVSQHWILWGYHAASGNAAQAGEHRAALATLVGRFADQLPVGLEFPPAQLPPVPSQPDLISMALLNRPEIELAARRQERSELIQRQARVEGYPDLILGFGYAGTVGELPLDETASATVISSVEEQHDSWSGSVGFSVPVPNSRRRAMAERARATARTATLDMAVLESVVVADVRRAVAELNAVQAREATAPPLDHARDYLLAVAAIEYAVGASIAVAPPRAVAPLDP